VQRGYGRLEWAVLDWNAPAIGFYDRLGASSVDDWRLRRLDGEALQRAARGERPAP
jgi:RimJ/RimL family protein N-acetyltransferase